MWSTFNDTSYWMKKKTLHVTNHKYILQIMWPNKYTWCADVDFSRTIYIKWWVSICYGFHTQETFVEHLLSLAFWVPNTLHTRMLDTTTNIVESDQTLEIRKLVPCLTYFFLSVQIKHFQKSALYYMFCS